MSCISKPTFPTSCSPELYTACPTMINVHEWLMIHHTSVIAGLPERTYDVFAVAEFPMFATKAEYINTSIGIPLGPVTVEFSTKLDIRRVNASLPDLVSASIKYPLLASVKGGAFRGDLHSSRGISMSIGVPEVYGSVRLWIEGGTHRHPDAALWIDFKLSVFGEEHHGRFAVLPIPRWFMRAAPGNSEKLLQAPASKVSAFSVFALNGVDEETNNGADDVTLPVDEEANSGDNVEDAPADEEAVAA
ncbi:hypothetical protein BD309DRAFT_993554 [Dichomitus squalens]|uniref:Uncharacterized protein n=1 Tax=Dichomitus squalens TaxID=114155 RepID=A0A4Q9Q2M8_9APHY|nr:hypothetical protein BD309DRAFT_993554 [Dichomitus squalens]TBU61379.1 hypothetical protein BD310DRAFT_812955 [Dichomitus squalens]